MTGHDTVRVAARPAGETVRKYRIRLLIDGRDCEETPVRRFSMTRSRYARCDTASLTLAIDRALLARKSVRWWDVPAASETAKPDVWVDVQLRDETAPEMAWQSVFSGVADHAVWTPDRGMLEVDCRDALAKLMDLRLQQAWMNQTGTDLLNSVIEQAGLKASLALPGDALTGQFWQIEHKRNSAIAHHRFQTGYDLARYVAESAECELYAQGETIFCHPLSAPDETTLHPIRYVETRPDAPMQAPLLSCVMARDYASVKNVAVHALSWDSRQRAKAEIYWSAAGGSRSRPVSSDVVHGFKRPGLRQDRLEQFARRKYREIVAHGHTLLLSLPGRMTLAPRHFVAFTGTESSWDQTYIVDAVESRLSFEEGFVQTVTLRSHPLPPPSGDFYAGQ